MQSMQRHACTLCEDKKSDKKRGEEQAQRRRNIQHEIRIIDWKLSLLFKKQRNQSLTVELMETTCVAGASVRIESVMVSAAAVAAAPPGAGGIVFFSREARKKKKRKKKKRKKRSKV